MSKIKSAIKHWFASGYYITTIAIAAVLYMMFGFVYLSQYTEQNIPVKSVTVVNSANGRHYKVKSDKNKVYKISAKHMSDIEKDGKTNYVDWKFTRKLYPKFWFLPGVSY